MQRIIFFIADELATDSEKETIQKLNTLTSLAYEVHVRNAKIPNVHGSLEESDRVAGTIPEAYKNNLIIDPNALPVTLSSGEVIPVYISDGSLSEQVSLSVVNGKVNGKLPKTSSLIKNGDKVAVSDGAGSVVAGTHSVSVGNGKLSGLTLDQSIAAIKDGDTSPFLNYDGSTELTSSTKATVSGSKLKGVILPETATLVRNNDNVSMTDANGISLGTVKVAVAKNVMSTPKLSSLFAAIKNGDKINLVSATGGVMLQNLAVTVADGKASGLALPATNAVVKSSDTVSVEDSNGTSAGNGVATVVNNAISQLRLDSTRAVINPGNTIPIQNSAGASVENASVSITAGKATAKLSAGVAPVKDGAVLSLPVVISSLLAVGTATKSVKIKVENGVITGLTI